MQHNPLMIRNIEIDQAQYQARARSERQSRGSERSAGRGSATHAIIGRLLRR
jgi:hypothetical protein